MWSALLTHDPTQLLLAFGLALPRIAGAFIILPLFTPESAPPLVRNSIFVGLAVILIPTLLPGLTAHSWAGPAVAALATKELMLGLFIGFSFSAVFWSISVVGGIIDAQVGNTFAQQLDPVQGGQSSPNTRWLNLFAVWIFMASGGLLVFLDVLFGSYQLWPITQMTPALEIAQLKFFVDQFQFLMSAGLMLAAPVVVVLLLVDLTLGLVNRFAQQLNVYSISMPTKSIAATLVLMMCLGLIAEVLVRRFAAQANLPEVLSRVFNAG